MGSKSLTLTWCIGIFIAIVVTTIIFAIEISTNGENSLLLLACATLLTFLSAIPAGAFLATVVKGTHKE